MIPIYKQEIEAGLQSQIATANTVAFISSIREADLSENTKAVLKQNVLKYAIGEANPEQFDLLYLESVLVSTGWNKNDDVFGKDEVWNSRNTPVDKQFNYMHNEADIIGHMTSSKVVDFNGYVISNETPFDDVPGDVDIVVGSVLYKYWSDAELQKRMNNIIAGIGNNEWFVSMECLFKNFDYAVVHPDGRKNVVARNEESSFLTKHLRIYGGTGEFDGYKVGRLLKNLSFSGKGLVNNPANPRSDILTFNNRKENNSFAGVYTSVRSLKDIYEQENIMSTSANTESVISKAQYDELKAELDSVKSANEKAVNQKISSLEKEVSELTESISNLNTELDASKEIIAAKDEKVKSLETELEEVNKNLAEARDNIKAINLETAKASRLAKLLSIGIDNEKAVNLVDKFVNASDDMFDALVESFPVKKEADAEEDEDKKDKKDKKKHDVSAEEVNTDNLDQAETEEADADLNVYDKEVETTLSKAAAWFSGSILEHCGLDGKSE